MTDRTLIRLAKVLFAVICLCLVVGLVGIVLLTNAGMTDWRDTAGDLGFAVIVLIFPIVGVVVATRQPRNAIGWVLLGVGFAWQFSHVLDVYSQWGLFYDRGGEAPVAAAAWSSGMWIPGLVPLGTYLILLFPDGHLPTPRWRWWARLSGAVMATAFAAILLFPGEIDGMPGVQNPLAIDALGVIGDNVFLLIVLIPICIIGCAVALVLRYRRSQGVQRLQLKWLAAAGAVVAVVYLVTMVASIPYDWAQGATIPLWLEILQNGSLFTFLLIPVAVGVAITRYRLYDIDRLINRALVYGSVSAALIGVYVLGVVGAGGAFRAVSGQEQGNLAVAGSTLAVAALFRPVRTSMQRFIDRRFYRSKYDAARTVEAFSARLRHETDLGELSDQLRGVVDETMQPSRVSLWIAAAD